MCSCGVTAATQLFTLMPTNRIVQYAVKAIKLTSKLSIICTLTNSKGSFHSCKSGYKDFCFLHLFLNVGNLKVTQHGFS